MLAGLWTTGQAAPPVVVKTAGRSKSAGKDKARSAATASARTWLRLVDRGQYEQAWDKAAQYLKNAVSRDQFVQAVKAVRGPLGKPGKRTIAARDFHTSLPGMPDGEYLVMQLKSSFANKAASVEIITPMLDKDGQWRVAGYYIR